jgi:hypothetical protein
LFTIKKISRKNAPIFIVVHQKNLKIHGESPIQASDPFKPNHFNPSAQASDPRLYPVCHPSQDASDASTDGSSLVVVFNPVNHVNLVQYFPLSEPEKKKTYPENEQLMPENEPENILKISASYPQNPIPHPSVNSVFLGALCVTSPTRPHIQGDPSGPARGLTLTRRPVGCRRELRLKGVTGNS